MPRPLGSRSAIAGVRDHRGQIVPVIAVALLLAGVLGLGLIHLGAAAARQAAAQAAADAVALAAASDGEEAAHGVAGANDASIEELTIRPGDAQVTVERRGHRATARARRLPADPVIRPSPSGAGAAHPVDCRPCPTAPVKPVPM